MDPNRAPQDPQAGIHRAPLAASAGERRPPPGGWAYCPMGEPGGGSSGSGRVAGS